MNEICDKNICSGCGACENICPKSCIKLEPDEYGCLYPSIDSEKCLNCGLCRKVCIQNNKPEKLFPLKTYAAYLKDFNERLDCSSGGVAKSFYQEWLKQDNTYIVGVMFDENMQTNFIVTNDIEDIAKFQGSKYVQAFTKDIYIKIETLLKDNKKILFVGMPCHTAAILNYLKQKNISLENILTIDLLCHGVSPHQYLDEQIEYIKKKNKIKTIKKLTFRSNRRFKNFHFVINNYNDYSYENPYFYGFLKGITLRESCYNCQFSDQKRVSDITIGDFIGLANEIPFDGNKINASLILCNTQKGINYVSEIEDLYIQERTFEEAYKEGASLQKPFQKHKYRSKFLKYYKSGNFVKTICKIAFWDLFLFSLKVYPKKVWVKLFMKDLLK